MAHESFISCNYSPAMSGHFATLYAWSPQADGTGFYEPYETDTGRYATLDEAEASGRAWAAQEGVAFVPVDREAAAIHAARSAERAAYVRALRDGGMDLREAHMAARAKFPFGA